MREGGQDRTGRCACDEHPPTPARTVGFASVTRRLFFSFLHAARTLAGGRPRVRRTPQFRHERARCRTAGPRAPIPRATSHRAPMRTRSPSTDSLQDRAFFLATRRRLDRRHRQLSAHVLDRFAGQLADSTTPLSTGCRAVTAPARPCGSATSAFPRAAPGAHHDVEQVGINGLALCVANHPSDHALTCAEHASDPARSSSTSSGSSGSRCQGRSCTRLRRRHSHRRILPATTPPVVPPSPPSPPPPSVPPRRPRSSAACANATVGGEASRRRRACRLVACDDTSGTTPHAPQLHPQRPRCRPPARPLQAAVVAGAGTGAAPLSCSTVRTPRRRGDHPVGRAGADARHESPLQRHLRRRRRLLPQPLEGPRRRDRYARAAPATGRTVARRAVEASAPASASTSTAARPRLHAPPIRPRCTRCGRRGPSSSPPASPPPPPPSRAGGQPTPPRAAPEHAGTPARPRDGGGRQGLLGFHESYQPAPVRLRAPPRLSRPRCLTRTVSPRPSPTPAPAPLAALPTRALPCAAAAHACRAAASRRGAPAATAPRRTARPPTLHLPRASFVTLEDECTAHGQPELGERGNECRAAHGASRAARCRRACSTSACRTTASAARPSRSALPRRGRPSSSRRPTPPNGRRAVPTRRARRSGRSRWRCTRIRCWMPRRCGGPVQRPSLARCEDTVLGGTFPMPSLPETFGPSSTRSSDYRGLAVDLHHGQPRRRR